MAVADQAVVSRLQDGAVPNAVDNNADEPFALQSLCMSCYENVSLRRTSLSTRSTIRDRGRIY